MSDDSLFEFLSLKGEKMMSKQFSVFILKTAIESLRNKLKPKYFNPAAFLRLFRVWNFCPLHVLFRFHLFMLRECIGADLSLYLCILMFWGQLQRTLWYEDFLVHWWSQANTFIPVSFFFCL